MLNIVHLGLISYKEALDIQNDLNLRRQKDEIGDTLLLLEHLPVLTLGTRGKQENIYLPTAELARRGIEIFKVDRGGDVTFHGPGQIVGYPIIHLKENELDIRAFIGGIKTCMIKLLAERFGIEAYGQSDTFTGVWVGDKKITAIGVSIHRWVTMHGFAFNVNTDLSYFKLINPCGLSKGVTSVEELTGKKEDMEEMIKQVGEAFAREFDFSARFTDINHLESAE